MKIMDESIKMKIIRSTLASYFESESAGFGGHFAYLTFSSTFTRSDKLMDV